MKETFLQLYGGKLLKNGYPIVPIAKGEKHPKGIKGWQNERATQKSLNNWIRMGYPGVGIQASKCVGVDLDIYNGPMDLLLYLIRREEVQVADIPIVRITEQYLAYLDLLTAMAITIASVVVVGATLVVVVGAGIVVGATVVTAAEVVGVAGVSAVSALPPHATSSKAPTKIMIVRIRIFLPWFGVGSFIGRGRTIS